MLHRGRFITFRVDTIEDAEGKRHTREIVEHPGAVCIIPILGADVLMVRQFRTPVGRCVLELPAGTLDRLPDGTHRGPGAGGPARAGRGDRSSGRDVALPGPLLDGSGFHQRARCTSTWPPTWNQSLDYAGPDEDEYLEVSACPGERPSRMAEDGSILDAKTLVGLLRLARLADAGELS